MGTWSVAIVLAVLGIGFAPAAQVGASSAPSGEEALVAPNVISPPKPRAPGPGPDDLSEFFMGSVGVGVFLVESSGTAYDWSDAEVAETLDGIYDGLDWWASYEPRGRLSFEYELHVREPTTYEPIQRSINDDGDWIHEILTNRGYSDPAPWSKARHFNRDLRARLATDWAYTIFVVDSEDSVGQGLFVGGGYAHAYYGGPWVTMSRFSSWAYNSGDYFRVVPAHETGHIFYATDEYNGVQETSGYLNCPDRDFSQGIMNRNTLSVSDSTRCQIGWVDTDGDGIFDILDEPPETSLALPSPDPTSECELRVTGTATVVAHPNRNRTARGTT